MIVAVEADVLSDRVADDQEGINTIRLHEFYTWVAFLRMKMNVHKREEATMLQFEILLLQHGF